MDDPELVRGLERVADLDADPRRPLDRERAFGREHVVERAATDQLHRDEQPAIVRLAEVEHADGVGLRQLARELGLALEPAHAIASREKRDPSA